MSLFNEHHQIRLTWLIKTLRLRRDLLEGADRNDKAESLALLANELSSGLGIVAQGVKISADRAVDIERAAIAATDADILVPIGLSDYEPEFSATRSALFWLAEKMKKFK